MTSLPTPRGLASRLMLLLLLFGQPAIRRPTFPSSAPKALLPVLLLAGQSNMVGWGTNVNDLPPTEQLTQTQTLFFGPNELGASWGWLVPPTTTANRFGPEISLGETLTQRGVYDLVAQVKYAVGNTSLAVDWDPNGSGSLYSKLLAREAAAVTSLQAAYPDRDVTVAGFFWMQGESDANDPLMAAAYGAHLAGLIARLRADLNAPQLPVMVGRIRNDYFPYADAVRQGQAAVAASVTNVRLVDTDALPLASDHIHYTSLGTVGLGVAFADSYQAWRLHRYQVFGPLITVSSIH